MLVDLVDNSLLSRDEHKPLAISPPPTRNMRRLQHDKFQGSFTVSYVSSVAASLLIGNIMDIVPLAIAISGSQSNTAMPASTSH